VTLTAAESLEILELVARVDDCATTRDASAYAELFTDDGTMTAAMGSATGRAELRDAVAAVWAAEPPDALHLTLNATIDESGPEPKVTSVLLIVTRGPAPRVLGSAVVRQVVRRTADGWRIASRVIQDASMSEPATAHTRAPSTAEPQSATRGTSLLAGSFPRGPGGALPVRLQSPSAGGVVRAVIILTACALVLYLIWRVRVVVRLVAISLFLALALFPLVDAVATKTRVPRALIILTIYVLLIASVAVVGYVVVPSLVKEVGQLSHDAPRYATDLRENATFRHYDNRYHITTKLVDDARRLPQLLGHLVGPLKDVTVQAASFIGQLVTVLALGFLLLLHGRQYVNAGLSLAGDREERYHRVVIDINKAVADYVLGNIVISVLATIATWIVLSILGVPYALSLGFLVGFFDLLPLVGATLGAIVVAVATVAVDFPTATIVWLAFIIVWQRFEDYVIQPLVYGRTLRVNPIVTIVSVLAGAALLGILGALLAIPTAAAIQIVLREWWANRQHPDRTAQSPSTQGARGPMHGAPAGEPGGI
jgi:predicted PurR-regulated permease PerM/ketosteroid isomerase-like protein